MARSKSKNKARAKRSIRHREKSSDVKFDKMIGRCTRRDWGAGLASNQVAGRMAIEDDAD